MYFNLKTKYNTTPDYLFFLQNKKINTTHQVKFEK